MNYLKRSRFLTVDYSDQNSIKRFQLTTVHTNRSLCPTHFEDLSNEIIYEIFEYLDAYDIYKGFMNLNIRFQNLIFNSSIPLKINILSLSKSTFYGYYTQLIVPNIHRIRSFHVSDPFIPELLHLLTENLSKFTRIETLILNNIESIYLENLLHHLISFPYLYSLTIINKDPDPDKSSIYHSIFQLPVLKYCQLVFTKGFGSHFLPTFDHNFSPIEHLIMKGKCNLEIFAAILSYLPQLRRLSINYLLADNRDQTELFPIVLNHLTHASLDLNCIQFLQFIPLVKKLFQNLQVLHISTRYGDYLNGYRWEQLILSSMPYLRVFDIQYTDFVFNNGSMIACQDLLNGFMSPFWIERQWFFAHRHNWGRYTNRGIFYSTQPYRRKYYILSGKYDQERCLCNENSNFNAVRHIDIRDEELMNTCSSFFPNVTELTISTSSRRNSRLIPAYLSRIIPLKQIITLTINSQNFLCHQLIAILCFTPNCHTLKFDSILFPWANSTSLYEFVIFQTKLMKNKIQNLIMIKQCTLQTITILVKLLPKLEHITINVSDQSIQPIVQFLLSKDNPNTRHLFSLCFSRLNIENSQILKTFIDSAELLDDYFMKTAYGDCFLWW